MDSRSTSDCHSTSCSGGNNFEMHLNVVQKIDWEKTRRHSEIKVIKRSLDCSHSNCMVHRPNLCRSTALSREVIIKVLFQHEHTLPLVYSNESHQSILSIDLPPKNIFAQLLFLEFLSFLLLVEIADICISEKGICSDSG
mmetsp:Transcript_7442/g.27855  ORF Transcript_7442/g.27855 Transcript_7442/m.27855 type:complete len:140 (-) Transcript_7442:1539-1958(-)